MNSNEFCARQRKLFITNRCVRDGKANAAQNAGRVASRGRQERVARTLLLKINSAGTSCLYVSNSPARTGAVLNENRLS